MDNLSPEIISLIANHLLAKPKGSHPTGPRPSTSPRPSDYACISRRWQAAAEPHSFAEIRLSSTELPALAALFSSRPHRRALLRRLACVVCLPTHGDSRADHARNLEAFGSSTRGLLDLLARWEAAPGDRGGAGSGRLSLHLGFAWDVDSDADGPVDQNFDVCKSSSARRYLTLEGGIGGQGVGLPSVQRVKDFRVEVSLGLAPHPATMCQLAGLFPSLEGLDLEYRDPAIKRHEMRQEHRVALGDGLRELTERLPKLKRLCIRRQGATDPWNHSFASRSLEEGGVDILCDSVRQVVEAGTLTELVLVDVLLSPDLFRDPRRGDKGSVTSFPSLRRFDIKVGILAPSGEWYYTGDPAAVEAGSSTLDDMESEDEEDSDGGGSDDGDSDDGDSDDDEDNTERDAIVNGERPHHPWRTRLNTETFDPLVKSLSEAVLRGMPSLEWGSLEIGTDQDTPVGVIMQCCAAGQAFVQAPGRIETDDISVRRWKTCVGFGTEWQVPEDVTALWEEWVGDEGNVEMSSWPPMSKGQ